MRGRIAAVLLGTGIACSVIGWTIQRRQSSELAPRPAAAGDVGVLTVYGQTDSGPVPLIPRRTARLSRPQDLAFQFTAQGRGPRLIRLVLTEGERSWVMHEERVEVPVQMHSLDYVMRLGEEHAAELRLDVAVEAPHARTVVTQYLIQLIGAEK